MLVFNIKMTYFFDSYAIIEMDNGINPSYQRFQEFEIVTGILNIGEIYQIILRKDGKNLADEWFRNSNFKLLEITPDIIVKSIYFRHINKKKDLSLTDCVGYLLSLQHKLKFLTGDKQFEHMQNVEFVK